MDEERVDKEEKLLCLARLLQGRGGGKNHASPCLPRGKGEKKVGQSGESGTGCCLYYRHRKRKAAAVLLIEFLLGEGGGGKRKGPE